MPKDWTMPEMKQIKHELLLSIKTRCCGHCWVTKVSPYVKGWKAFVMAEKQKSGP